MCSGLNYKPSENKIDKEQPKQRNETYVGSDSQHLQFIRPSKCVFIKKTVTKESVENRKYYIKVINHKGCARELNPLSISVNWISSERAAYSIVGSTLRLFIQFSFALSGGLMESTELQEFCLV